MPVKDPKISVYNGDILEFPCTVLVLKYAQWWYGADLAVATALGLGKGWDSGGEFLKVGEFKIVDTNRKIAADRVLFEGVPSLRQLNYSLIREFSRRAMLHLHQDMPDARHVGMTVHGVNIGMDERETFLSQLAGLTEALSADHILPGLEQITIVERNAARAKRLSEVLQADYSPRRKLQQDYAANSMNGQIANAGLSKNEKPHVFVAMPFSQEMDDVFIFGIQGPVQEAGFLCERVDQAIFTGDIVERIKSRIETAKLVIADLSGANANVYLEVGYAWGSKVNTLLVCRNVDELKFDVKGHRCVVYSSINDLRKKLAAELKVHVG